MKEKKKTGKNDKFESSIKAALKRSSDSDSEGSPVKKNKENEFDPTTYKPEKAKYHPIADAAWSKGDSVPYMACAMTLKAIEEESSRLRMIEILSNFLSSVMLLSPKETVASIYLFANKVAPDYEGIELGVGDSVILKALAEATGRKTSQIKTDMEKLGDIGLVAERSRLNQPTVRQPPKLFLTGVYQKLKEIALLSGHSSMTQKTNVIKGLIVSCRGSEARYVVRSLTGKMRIGLAEQSLLNAIGQAATVYENPKLSRSSDEWKQKSDETIAFLKEAYCECPNFDKIVNVILEEGTKALPEKCRLTPGIPLKPMLAHPSKGIQEVLRRFEDNSFTCEYKYDGERAQIHLDESGNISVFSRNQENNTTKYPDIIGCIPPVKKEGVTSFILDSEAVAWDRENKKILPFQVLSTRKRKDVKEEDIKVKVCVFAFDILYLNGESLTKKTLRERRELLRSSFNPEEGIFVFAQGADVTTTEEIQEMIDESVKDRCEGLMVKCLDKDATYEIAKRSRNWLKVKKDYLDGVGDSLDLVVIGAWKGKGKRTGNYGGFLLACYDPEEEEYQTVCKIGTGFSDEDLRDHTKFLEQHVIPEPKVYYNWDEGVRPDVWFDAVQVWEVKCADLSVSPIHRAAIGKVDENKGISIRFPRFIRVREDKKPEQATSADQVVEMYSTQSSVKDDDNLEEDEDN
jgi:DNA ligase-1